MSPPQSLRRPRRLCQSSARASSAESLAAFRSIKSTRRSADGPGAAQNRNQGQISEGASCWRRATPCHAIKSRRETTPRVHPNAAAPLQSGTRHATPSRQNASKASRVPRPGPSLHGPAKLGKTTRLALAPPRHRGPGRPGRSRQHGARQHRPAGPCPGERPERASALRAARPSHAVSSPASGSQRGIRCCQAPRLIRVQRLPLPLAQPGIECDKGQPSRSARPAGPLAQPARSAMSGSSGRQALAAGDAHRAHHN